MNNRIPRVPEPPSKKSKSPVSVYRKDHRDILKRVPKLRKIKQGYR